VLQRPSNGRRGGLVAAMRGQYNEDRDKPKGWRSASCRPESTARTLI
jgi:hypothetical protein